MKHKLTMTGFPGYYSPFGVDTVVLIECFSAVQLPGRSRTTDSHARYASLNLTSEHLLGTTITTSVRLILEPASAVTIQRVILPISLDTMCDLKREALRPCKHRRIASQVPAGLLARVNILFPMRNPIGREIRGQMSCTNVHGTSLRLIHPSRRWARPSC